VILKYENRDEVTKAGETALSIPEDFQLEPNFPNPFNSGTVFNYKLAKSAHVELSVYNVNGRRLCRLIPGLLKPAGDYSVNWDGLDSNGQTVSSGLYFARMFVKVPGQASQQFSHKMILLR